LIAREGAFFWRFPRRSGKAAFPYFRPFRKKGLFFREIRDPVAIGGPEAEFRSK